MIITLIFAVMLGFVAWQYWRALQKGTGTKKNTSTLFSTDVDDKRIPQQQAEEMAPLFDLVEAEGFEFEYYIKTHFGNLDMDYTEALFLNPDRTIKATVIGQVGELPPAIELFTVFNDDAHMVTTSPWGEPIDSSMFYARHAYDPFAAIDYHRNHVPKMEPLHGPAVPVTDFETYVSHQNIYNERYRPLFHARINAKTRGHLIRTSITMLIVLALAGVQMMFINQRLWIGDVSVDVDTIAIALTLFVFFGVFSVNDRLDKRHTRFMGAIDEGINPPPVIGAPGKIAKRKDKQ